MKLHRITGPTVAVATLSLAMTGCVTTQGNDTYVSGQCVTCWENPLTVETPNNQGSSTGSTSSADGVTLNCRKASSKYDQTWHYRDKRWCGNTTLPGASLSGSVTYSGTVELPIDMAYIKAKRFLRFTDPNGNREGSSPYAARRWDAIPGSYYNVVGIYGGPMHQMLWYSEYDLQLEKVSSSRTKVSLRHRVYSRGMDPTEFRKQLMSAIRR